MRRFYLSPVLALLAFFFLMLFAVPAAAGSLFTYIDQTGQRHTYTDANQKFSIYQVGEQVFISITEIENNFIGWEATFGPPPGEKLMPGRYYAAQCGAFSYGRAPAMEIRNLSDVYCGDDPGHTGDEIWGWFSVRQIERDATGKIIAIEVSFNQQIKDFTQSLMTGVIRHGVEPLSFSLDGKIWKDVYDNKGFYGDTSLFRLEGDTSRVVYTAAGRRDFWAAYIEPPTGQELKVGTYELAESSGTTHAKVLLNGAPNGSDNGGYCPSVSGTLQIKAISTDTAGQVVGLSAVFEQHCGGDDPEMRIRGTIHHRF